MRTKVLLLYVMLCLIWGTTWIVLKVSLAGTPPVLGVALRFAISASVLWLVFLQRRKNLNLSPIALKVYVGFGALNFASSYSLTYWGTQFIYSGLSSVLWATLPIFIAVLAHFILPDERFTPKKLVGGITGLAGTVLIFAQGTHTPEDFRIVGVIAVLFAVIIAAWPNVFLKLHHEQIDPLHLNVVSQSIAVFLLLPASFILEDPGMMVWSWENISALLYLAIFGTVITWSIYFWLFSHLTVTQISTVAFLPPVIAVFLGWLILGEALTSRMLIGSALVLVGVFIVNIQHPKEGTGKTAR